MTAKDPKTPSKSTGTAEKTPKAPKTDPDSVPEIGGREGPDPTRYGDWEKNGRCIDF